MNIVEYVKLNILFIWYFSREIIKLFQFIFNTVYFISNTLITHVAMLLQPHDYLIDLDYVLGTIVTKISLSVWVRHFLLTFWRLKLYSALWRTKHSSAFWWSILSTIFWWSILSLVLWCTILSLILWWFRFFCWGLRFFALNVLLELNTLLKLQDFLCAEVLIESWGSKFFFVCMRSEHLPLALTDDCILEEAYFHLLGRSGLWALHFLWHGASHGISRAFSWKPYEAYFIPKAVLSWPSLTSFQIIF